jgi:hypothetical protein
VSPEPPGGVVVSGQNVTFNGPFTVPPTGQISLHFSVNVGTANGRFCNQARGTAVGVSGGSTGSTACIQVGATPTPTHTGTPRPSNTPTFTPTPCGASGTCTPTPTITPKPSTIGNDTDLDGCSDSEEQRPNPVLGGDRDYLYYWDFYDVTFDKAIDLADTLQILALFGDPGISGYANRHDRVILDQSKPWRTSEANDGIDLRDALNNLKSFGHDCGEEFL